MCFPFGSLETFLIWLVIVCGIVAIIQVLLRVVAGVPAWIIEILRIVMWVVIACAVISLIFGLLACVWPLPRLR